MGSLVRTILNSPACIRSQRLTVIPILLLASGLITVPAQTRIVTTIAGLTHSVSGNGGLASQATVNYADAVALDAKGNLYIADTIDQQIRKIDASTGVITAVAGTGQAGYSGDGQLAVNAQLNYPEDVALDSTGNIYIADTGNQIIRKVSAATGVISTIAGTPNRYGFAGDGNQATGAWLGRPQGVAVDASGNIYIADTDNIRIRFVSAATGIISTVAGTSQVPEITPPNNGDGLPATQVLLSTPTSVAVDASDNFYLTTYCEVRKVSASTGIITDYAGNYTCEASGDNGPATSAAVGPSLGHIGLDPAGNLYIADYTNNAVRKVTASTGIITTIAGNGTFGFSGDGGPAAEAALNSPKGVAVAANGSIYISDFANLRIRTVAADGTISTVAGNGTTGAISNGPGTSTSLGLYGYRWYNGVVADASGNIYFADSLNNVIRKMTPAGEISTVAGTGFAGYGGDGGAATSAELNNPDSVAFDARGNLYIADTQNNVIRKIDASTGKISTYAGTYAQYAAVGYTLTPNGDGGPATSAGLPNPTGIALDNAGNLYIAEEGWGLVRRVTPAGIVSTYAGKSPVSGASNGDGGPATSADLSPLAATLAVDSQGDLFIGDNTAVREVVATTGIINTVAGEPNSIDEDSGDGGAATSGWLSQIYGLAFDSAGNLYIADWYVVREVNQKGIINTAAGEVNVISGPGYSGDGGLATNALTSPEGVTVDSSGNIYFTDSLGNRIRKVSNGSVQGVAATPAFSPAPGEFSSNPTVTITTTTPGAQIFYTLDGSTPNPGTSPLYTTPITLVAPVTLSAITVAPGYSTSNTASGTYTSNETTGPPPAPGATLSPTSLNFSSEAVGSTSAAQSVTLTNSGNAALSITSISASTNFAETNNCGANVAAAANCTISVTFTPTAGGTFTGAITITDNAPDSPQTVALSGSGANVSVSTTSTGMSASSGGSATASIQASSAGGFSGTVNFTCSVAFKGPAQPRILRHAV